MNKVEFDQIIRENFDLSDDYTRKYIISLKEDAQQEQLLRALSISLYESIVSKVDDIDFGSIPMSRGDITKVQGFDGTVKCLNTIRDLVIQYKQNPSVVDVVISAIENVKDRKHLFVKGYALDAEFPMLIYNLIVLAIERCTSLMIATCIQFIKDPSTTTPRKALDKVAYKKTMEDVMFKQLISFNNMCRTKEIDKQLEASMKPIRESVDVDTYPDTVMPVADEVPSNNVQDMSADELFGEPAGQDVTSSPDECGDCSDGSCGPAGSIYTPGVTTMPAEDTEPGQEPNNNSTAAQEPTGPEDECGDNEFMGQSSFASNTFSNVSTPTTASTEEIEPEPDAVPYQSTRGQSVDVTPERARVNMPADDEEIDIESIPYEDDVEPENIPTVNPGDAVSSSDAPINEDDDEDDTPLEEMSAADVTSSILKGLQKVSGVENLSDLKNKNVSKAVKIGGAVVAAIGVTAGIFLAKNIIIGLIRKIIYTAYYTKAKFSDYLDIQADLLEANANDLELSTNSGLDDEAKSKVIKKQLATAEKFRKWSNFFAIDKKQTEAKVNKASKEDEEKTKKIAKDDDGDDALF